MTTAPHDRVVVFDLGGVLIDWNPRYLYRSLFDGDDAAMERFLAEVCTPAWNDALDAGRPFAEAVDELCRAFPDEAERIAAYDARWPEMLGGPIEGTVEILRRLRDAGVPVYALSNWSRAKFDVTRPHYPFLGWFDGVVISGDVRATKPDRRIFEHLFATFGFPPGRAVFIDDNAANVDAAEHLGMATIRFTSPDALAAELEALGLLR